MRIYLPCTLRTLATALERREFRDAPLTAYAVTPALRESLGEDDTEELEYAALAAAAAASLRLLAADPQAPRRRVVIAAEVPDAGVALPERAPENDPAMVTVTRPVPLKRVASGHVDDPAAADDIAAAAETPESEDHTEHELMWYATQELAYLDE